MARLLHELRAPEIADRLGPSSVLVLPVGAIEQHGPHLPLSTDLDVASGLAERVVETHGDALDLWLLPPLAYSKSDEHGWAPGTMWLSATTFLAVLGDLGRSLATLPTRRLAFVNGHGGNTAILDVASRELRLHHDLLTFLLNPRMPRDGGYADEGELEMGVHAGRDETAMMLVLRPDLVDMSRAVRSVPEAMAAREHVKFGGTASFGWRSTDLAANGQIGDATGATTELGQRIVDEAVDQLAAQLAEIGTFAFPEG